MLDGQDVHGRAKTSLVVRQLSLSGSISGSRRSWLHSTVDALAPVYCARAIRPEVLAEHVAAVRLCQLAHRPSPRLPMAAGLADRTTPAERIDSWMQAIAHARARGYTSARPPRQLAEQPLALWRAYQTYKHDQGLIDLDDLIDLPVRCAAGGAGAARLAGLFDAVLVDEVQDTSPVQLDLIDAIAPRGGLTVVGDLDQSIYRFRGAAPAELLSWIDRARQLPEPDRMVVVDLNRTYRCTEPITATAQRLIEHNRDRLPRTTVSLRGDGPPNPPLR